MAEPLAARKQHPRIFYGWYVIGVGMLGTFLGTSTSQLFMGVALKPMTEDLGWSRTAASGAITLGTLASGLLAPLMGRLVDRHGPRALTAIGALIAVVAEFGIAGLTELWHFYLAYVVGRAFAATTIAGVVPNTAAANWFRRMRGRVLGLLAMALSLGGSVISFVGQLIIEAHDWRMAFRVFGLLLLVLLVPAAVVLLRRRPEDIGLLPDGDSPGVASKPAGGRAPEQAVAYQDEFGWTLGEALRTPALWLIITAIMAGVLGSGGVAFHQVAYYTDIGISATVAALSISLYAFSGAMASAAWGFLCERYPERYMATLAMVIGAVTIFAMLFVRSAVAALGLSVAFGLASRGESALVNVILAQYYGRRAYGAINGFVIPFQQLSLGLGPLVASLFFDFSGSYQIGLIFFAVAYAIAALLFWLARKPALPDRARQPAIALEQPD